MVTPGLENPVNQMAGSRSAKTGITVHMGSVSETCQMKGIKAVFALPL